MKDSVPWNHDTDVVLQVQSKLSTIARDTLVLVSKPLADEGVPRWVRIGRWAMVTGKRVLGLPLRLHFIVSPQRGNFCEKLRLTHSLQGETTAECTPTLLSTCYFPALNILRSMYVSIQQCAQLLSANTTLFFKIGHELSVGGQNSSLYSIHFFCGPPIFVVRRVFLFRAFLQFQQNNDLVVKAVRTNEETTNSSDSETVIGHENAAT